MTRWPLFRKQLIIPARISEKEQKTPPYALIPFQVTKGDRHNYSIECKVAITQKPNEGHLDVNVYIMDEENVKLWRDWINQRLVVTPDLVDSPCPAQALFIKESVVSDRWVFVPYEDKEYWMIIDNTHSLITPKKAFVKIMEKWTSNELPKLMEPKRLLQELYEKIGKSTALTEEQISSVLALLILESVVNYKLESLGDTTSGSFNERYKRLSQLLYEKEKRKLPSVLPQMLYEGLRHLAAHSMHKFRPNTQEAKVIIEAVSLIVNSVAKN